MRDESGKMFGAALVLQDVTRFRLMDEVKTNLVSTVSHELRTPLTSVLGFAKIIRRRLEERLFPLIPEQDRRVQQAKTQVIENLGVVVSEGERLTKLIDEVMEAISDAAASSRTTKE